MIDKLEIHDYRSCIETTIDLQPDLSVLIGPNGSGKTNILNACLLLRSLSKGDDRRQYASLDIVNECRLKTTFKYDDKKSILTTKMRLHNDENNDDVILDAEQSWYAKDFTGSAKRIKTPLSFSEYYLPQRLYYGVSQKFYMHFYTSSRLRGYSPEEELIEPFRSAFVKTGEFLRDIKYYSASQFTNPSLCPVSFEVEQEGENRRGINLEGHSKFLYDLYEAYEADETTNYETFFNVIGPAGIGLVDKIEFRSITTSSIDYTVRSGGDVQTRQREKSLVIPQFIIGRNTLSPNQLSEGTFKTITLLFYLMTEKSSALLIEEPEVCVHHGLLSSIVELIKTYSKQKQIIVSTHSDFVLDQIEPRHVFKVSRISNEGTKVNQISKSMSSQELKALKRYLETEGNLGEYWRHGGFD